MILDQLEEWRKATLASRNLSFVADLGYGVLDAVVEPAAFVFAAEARRIVTFYRLLSAPDKEAALAATIASRGVNRDTFLVENCWAQIPGNRIAYWAPNHWLDLFANKSVEDYASVSKGLETGEDERFLRLAVEVPAQELNRRWRGYAKGGDYQPIAGNYELVVDFSLFRVARRTTDAHLYGKPGVTYTQRTTSFLSFAVYRLEVSSARVAQASSYDPQNGLTCCFRISQVGRLELWLSYAWAQVILR
jgi:hypothetical protein